MTSPRGIRNNNPGNIRKGGDPWVGAVGDDGAFLRFVDPAHGIRAAARLLQTYQVRHELNTVREIVTRWAPPSENQTDAYIASVAIWADVEPDAPIDVHDYGTAYRLLRAIFRFENGKPPEGQDDWYAPEVYERGLRLAGVVPSKALTKSRTTTGVVAGGAGATVVVGAWLKAVWPEGADVIDAGLQIADQHWVEILAIAIGIAGQVRALLARVDDKLKGRL